MRNYVRVMIRRGLHLNVFLLTEAQTQTLTVRTVVLPKKQKTVTVFNSVAVCNGVDPKTKEVGR